MFETVVCVVWPIVTYWRSQKFNWISFAIIQRILDQVDICNAYCHIANDATTFSLDSAIFCIRTCLTFLWVTAITDSTLLT